SHRLTNGRARFAAPTSRDPSLHARAENRLGLRFFNTRSRHRTAGATMQTTRMTAMAIGLAAMCAAGLTAQTQETKTTTKTKVEIKDGKDVTVSGCLERRPNGDYILTEVHGKSRLDPV